MITDFWRGMSVYRSEDALAWTAQRNRILERPGTRPRDGAKGSHGCVVVQGGEAYIVYFVHYDPQVNQGRDSVIQAARLEVKDGVLCCDRDAPFAMDFIPEKTCASRGGEAAD